MSIKNPVQVFAVADVDGARHVGQLVQLHQELMKKNIVSKVKRVSPKYCGLFVDKKDYYDATTTGLEIILSSGQLWNVVSVSPYNAKMVQEKNGFLPNNVNVRNDRSRDICADENVRG